MQYQVNNTLSTPKSGHPSSLTPSLKALMIQLVCLCSFKPYAERGRFLVRPCYPWVVARLDVPLYGVARRNARIYR
jgi:hypothetical protein